MECGYEFERAKEKKRRLQDKIGELEEQISRKKALTEQLKAELEKLKAEARKDEERGNMGENKLNLFMKDVGVVFQAIVEEEAFIKAKYTTQSSQMYYKIEKDVFEGYIRRLAGLEVKDFVEFCKKLFFIKVENNKCTFPSGKTRVYFLNKGVVDELKG